MTIVELCVHRHQLSDRWYNVHHEDPNVLAQTEND